MTAPQPTQPSARPTTSPCAIVACVLGVLGVFLNVAGGGLLGALLAVATLVLSIVGLVRNEPARLCAAVGILAAVFAFVV